MPLIEESIQIAAPAEGLFALSQDYSLRKKWDPFTRDMRFQDGATEPGPGVRVWFRAWNGLTMEVEFITFSPPRLVAMKMVRGPWFLRRFAGSWQFREEADGSARVTFRYSFEGRWRWLDPFIAWAFRRDVRARLRGLKRGAEELGLLDQLGAGCP